MTTRIGFYGAGFIARTHARLLGASGRDHLIAAVHDPDPERATAFAARWGGSAVGEDELLELVDAVFVTTWTSEHSRLVAKVAAQGLPLFCEKPLAFDAPEAAGIVAVAAAAGVVNQVGLVLRAAPTFIVIKDLIAQQRSGRVLAALLRDDQYLPVQGQYASSWRGDPARAGHGTLLEHSVHDVDILQWMLGPVERVTGYCREVHGIAGIEDVVSATLMFDSGAVAQLLSVWHDLLDRPSMRYLEIFCERLHISLADEFAGPVRWQFDGEEPRSLEGAALVERAREVSDHDLGPIVEAMGGFVFNTAAEFLTAVQSGRPADPDLAAALPAHRIVDAIYASAADGGSPHRVATD